MIKKLVLGSLVALLLGLFFFGRDAVSYVRTSTGYVKDSVQESIPIGFQIDRARQMIAGLKGPIEKNVYLIAREEVETERLAKQIEATQARLAKEKEQILRLKADAASGKSNVEYGGRRFTVAQVKADLAARFERYKTGEATLTSLQDILTARQKGLEAGRQKLEAMVAARRQMQVDVEYLDARRQMVAAAETASKYHFDDSELGRVKELVSNLRTRLDVAEKLVNSEGLYQEEIPVGQATPANILEQINEHFADTPAPKAESLAQGK